MERVTKRRRVSAGIVPEHQGDDKQRQGDNPSLSPLLLIMGGGDPNAITERPKKGKVREFGAPKKDAAKAQAHDSSPTRGFKSPSPMNERNPDALLFSEREDWAEYVAEEARVKAWKFQKDICWTKGTYRDAQLKFFRPRRHGKLEKR